jgi:hypothetical protein
MTIFLLYTDPGSGMMLLQVLFAFFAGALFYFRRFFYKLFGKDKVPGDKLPVAKESDSEGAPNSKTEV